ncbi:MAG: SRPBCC family protein [Nocardiaceae bacterium]|nr:SRPBCC family protein [Nocardiaceae bacterium]
MAEETMRSITIEAPAADIMAVIADFERYPEWVEAAKEVAVLERQSDGRAVLVHFCLDAGPVKDTYALQYTWASDGLSVTWELVRSELQKTQAGRYSLQTEDDGSTTVTYELTLDLNIPVIGVIKRMGERVITDTALLELKKRVES